MDLRHMQYAVAVAEEGGFSAAARRLHVVQSAVSGTVRLLERELGVKLFHRTTHRVSLTPAGEAFLPAARAALQAVDQARASVDVVKDQLCGEIRVGVMQGLYAGLDQALASFHERHPGVVVKLRQAQAEDVRQAVRDGTLDLALVALDREQQRGLVTRLLSQEEMVLITAGTCRLSEGGPVTLSQVAALRLVDFPVGWAIRHSVDRAFRAALVERTTTFEVNDVLAATDLVRHDLGVCILPESLADRFPDLAVRRFAAHAPTWTVMVVRSRGEVSPAVAALLQHLK